MNSGSRRPLSRFSKTSFSFGKFVVSDQISSLLSQKKRNFKDISLGAFQKGSSLGV